MRWQLAQPLEEALEMRRWQLVQPLEETLEMRRELASEKLNS